MVFLLSHAFSSEPFSPCPSEKNKLTTQIYVIYFEGLMFERYFRSN